MSTSQAAYIAALEEAVLQAESALADIEAARRKGYLAQAINTLSEAAEAIRHHRAEPLSLPSCPGFSSHQK